MRRRNIISGLAIAGALAISSMAYGQGRLSGKVTIDGSSTVYPITEAVAEEFSKEYSQVRVTVGISGTGGGFKRFVAGETDISDASRPIKDSEYKAAMEKNIGFIEIPVAYDGLTIVVNKDNTWTDQLTVDQLKQIFLESKAAKTWKDVNPAWPATPIKIYAPGTDSGTFDYFKEVVAGKGDSIRGDMSVSEDDNVLVRGVAGERGSIGFFGAAYYFENADKLRAVPIVNDEGKAVKPTSETIESGEYNPFSRPLFIYVNADSAKRPEVDAFVKYYFKYGPELAEEVGYVRLPSTVYRAAEQRYAKGVTGTAFLDKDLKKVKGPITKVYKSN